MKVVFTAEGSVKSIESREFLVVGSNGVNILEAYTEYPFSNLSLVKATASFRRADTFVITNMEMKPSPVEAPTHFEIALNYDSGVLAVAGELEITIKMKGDGKTVVNGIICGKVNRAIGKPDETSVLYYKVHALELRVAELETKVQTLEGS